MLVVVPAAGALGGCGELDQNLQTRNLVISLLHAHFRDDKQGSQLCFVKPGQIVFFLPGDNLISIQGKGDLRVLVLLDALLPGLLQGLEHHVPHRAGYDAYEFHTVYRAVYNFCVVEMSNFYLDIIKDRLYCGDGAGRASAQSALYRIVDGMTRMLAPILAFTSQEIWVLRIFKYAWDSCFMISLEMRISWV